MRQRGVHDKRLKGGSAPRNPPYAKKVVSTRSTHIFAVASALVAEMLVFGVINRSEARTLLRR